MHAINEEQLNEIGEIADSIDNILAALSLPLTPDLHIKGIKGSLPEFSRKIKALVVEISGENPWEA